VAGFKVTTEGDATFDRVHSLLGEQQTVDLIVLSGTYVMVSMLLNTSEVGVPNNGHQALKPMTDAELRAGLLTVKSPPARSFPQNK
jgi:4-carboxymuconolactone decarboxylase